MNCSRCKRPIGRDDTYITQQDAQGTQIFCSAGCQVRMGMRPDITIVPNPEKLNPRPIKPTENKEFAMPMPRVIPLEKQTQIGGAELNRKPIVQGNVVDLRGIKK